MNFCFHNTTLAFCIICFVKYLCSNINLILYKSYKYRTFGSFWVGSLQSSVWFHNVISQTPQNKSLKYPEIWKPVVDVFIKISKHSISIKQKLYQIFLKPQQQLLLLNGTRTPADTRNYLIELHVIKIPKRRIQDEHNTINLIAHTRFSLATHFRIQSTPLCPHLTSKPSLLGQIAGIRIVQCV